MRFATAAGATAATSSGSRTAGVITLEGDFAQVRDDGNSSSNGFIATGSHKVIFAGTTAQTVSFASPGTTASRFFEVETTNPAGLVFVTGARVSGPFTISAGTVTGSSGGVNLGGNLVDQVGGRWQVAETTFSGTNQSLPATLTTNATWTGTATALPNGFALTGNLTVASGGTLSLSGRTIDVSGDLLVRLSNAVNTGLQLKNAADLLTIDGNATFTVAAGNFAAASNGNYTAGTIRVRRNFAQIKDDGNSAATGFFSTGTRVIFDGTSPQTVSFENPSNNQSRFHHVDVSNSAGVSLATTVWVSGQLAMVGSGALSSSGTVNYTTALPVTSATYDVASNRVAGNVTMGVDAIIPNGGDLYIDGNATLRLNGKTLTLDGDFYETLTNADGTGLVMTNAADRFNVKGNMRFATAAGATAATSSGSRTAGVITLEGDFAQVRDDGNSSSNGFIATGSHKVVFMGTTAQVVSFASPGSAASRFANVDVNSAPGVTLTTSTVATGTFNITQRLTVGTGTTATITGTLAVRSGATLVNSGTINATQCVIEAGSTLSGNSFACPL